MPNPESYNIVVWGAQECVRHEKEIQMAKLRNHLGDNFVQIGFVDMWEMFLVVLVNKKDHPFVKGTRSNYIALGVMGVVGNKGGLLLEFSLYDHTFSIMNCHLLSGAFKGEKRSD